MKKYRNDLIFVGVLIVIAGILYIGIQLFYSNGGKYIRITVDGREEKVLSLKQNTTYTIEHGDNINVVEIKDGQVSVKEANCRDGLCEKQGSISKNGEAIICLPHKVVITVISDEENDVDAVQGGMVYDDISPDEINSNTK